MTILDNIVSAKKIHVSECKTIINLKELEQSANFGRTPVSLRNRLLQANSSGIIAEFKRKSPSKGIINDKVTSAEVTLAYENSGVAGVSILTDSPFFGGSPNDLTSARNELSIPILRKDFIVDEFQIIEAKALGADLILLIAAILSKKEIKAFASLAKSLGLEILYEVHDREELEKVSPDVTIIGVNNRNLKTFIVDIQQSIDLAEYIPNKILKISESGIEKPESIKLLKNSGYNGFLIGESFMKTNDPGLACRNFINELRSE